MTKLFTLFSIIEGEVPISHGKLKFYQGETSLVTNIPDSSGDLSEL